MSHSNCNYHVQPLSDSDGSACGKPAIRRVILSTEEKQKEMFYCFTHWTQVKEYPLIVESDIEDLTEEGC